MAMGGGYEATAVSLPPARYPADHFGDQIVEAGRRHLMVPPETALVVDPQQ
jgi:hypothetical protein